MTTLETVRTILTSNDETFRTLAILKDSRGFWLHDIDNDPNADSLEQLADDSNSAVMDLIRDNGFEIATISLNDFNNLSPITYFWICGVGCPNGRDFKHNPEGESENDCVIWEIGDRFDLWELCGTVTDGRWEWDGVGQPTDELGNTITNVKAI